MFALDRIQPLFHPIPDFPFQALVAAIASDIIGARSYRVRRRREITRLKAALRSLGDKRAFFEEQVEYYNQYLKQCLAHQVSTEEEKGGKKCMCLG